MDIDESYGRHASRDRHTTRNHRVANGIRYGVKGPTLKGRTTVPLSRPSSAPGPGSYSPERTGPSARRAGPAFSLGSRHHAAATGVMPGPGSYFPERSGETNRRRAGFSFGSRHQPSNERSPGLAAYHPHVTRTGRPPMDAAGPGFSIYGRPTDKGVLSDAPGPGYYDFTVGRRAQRHLPRMNVFVLLYLP